MLNLLTLLLLLSCNGNDGSLVSNGEQTSTRSDAKPGSAKSQKDNRGKALASDNAQPLQQPEAEVKWGEKPFGLYLEDGTKFDHETGPLSYGTKIVIVAADKKVFYVVDNGNIDHPDTIEAGQTFEYTVKGHNNISFWEEGQSTHNTVSVFLNIDKTTLEAIGITGIEVVECGGDNVIVVDQPVTWTIDKDFRTAGGRVTFNGYDCDKAMVNQYCTYTLLVISGCDSDQFQVALKSGGKLTPYIVSDLLYNEMKTQTFTITPPSWLELTSISCAGVAQTPDMDGNYTTVSGEYNLEFKIKDTDIVVETKFTGVVDDVIVGNPVIEATILENVPSFIKLQGALLSSLNIQATGMDIEGEYKNLITGSVYMHNNDSFDSSLLLNPGLYEVIFSWKKDGEMTTEKYTLVVGDEQKIKAEVMKVVFGIDDQQVQQLPNGGYVVKEGEVGDLSDINGEIIATLHTLSETDGNAIGLATMQELNQEIISHETTLVSGLKLKPGVYDLAVKSDGKTVCSWKSGLTVLSDDPMWLLTTQLSFGGSSLASLSEANGVFLTYGGTVSVGNAFSIESVAYILNGAEKNIAINNDLRISPGYVHTINLKTIFGDRVSVQALDYGLTPNTLPKSVREMVRCQFEGEEKNLSVLIDTSSYSEEDDLKEKDISQVEIVNNEMDYGDVKVQLEVTKKALDGTTSVYESGGEIEDQETLIFTITSTYHDHKYSFSRKFRRISEVD